MLHSAGPSASQSLSSTAPNLVGSFGTSTSCTLTVPVFLFEVTGEASISSTTSVSSPCGAGHTSSRRVDFQIGDLVALQVWLSTDDDLRTPSLPSSHARTNGSDFLALLAEQLKLLEELPGT